MISVKDLAKAVNGTIIHGSADVNITSVSTNSKELEAGALFVPIIGKLHDAHDFIEDAYRHGAVACFSSRDEVCSKDLVIIKVVDTLKALQDFATYYRNQFDLSIVGITGSVGKTTTKEMISAVLSTKYNVLKTAGNMNSQVGLSLMMFKITKDHDLAVIEMGISEEGEMARLSSIARPDVSVITNIGVSHIGQLKSKENIRKEKLSIINDSDNSYIFINGDDPLLHEIKNNKSSQNFANMHLSETTQSKIKSLNIITYGINDDCDYKAKNIKVIDDKTYFTFIDSIDGVEEQVILSALGEHNIYNALSSLAIAKYYKIPTSIAKKALEDYKAIAMRGEIKKVNDITIIDDTYNASPDSMKSGIDTLLSISNVNRRIAILADILELGSLSQESHLDVGNFISESKVDELITIGQEAKFIAKGASDNNRDTIIHSFNNNTEAINYLKEIIRPGDALLVKGSRGMKTEEIIKGLL